MLKFFDPHIHMVSRTTDDYQNMAAAGITGVIEPAFWQGQARVADLRRLCQRFLGADQTAALCASRAGPAITASSQSTSSAVPRDTSRCPTGARGMDRSTHRLVGRWVTDRADKDISALRWRMGR